MFSLQLPKTSLRFQQVDTPRGVPCDKEQNTVDTHTALSSLLKECKRYVEALIIAGSIAIPGASIAQETPQKNNIPVGTIATQPIGKEIPGAMVTIELRVPEGRDVSQTSQLSSSPSASLQVTNGYGQTVDTPFGKLSFAEIQTHEKKDEILTGLKPSKQARYNEWEQQVAIKEGEKIDKGTQTFIETNGKKLEVQQAVMETNGKKLEVEHTANQEFIKKTTAYVETVEGNDDLIKKQKVLLYLRKLYQDPILPQDLISRIELLINQGG